MHKKPRLITQFATILVICMGALLLYVWLNYDDLRSDQAYRQMWYLNHKFDSNCSQKIIAERILWKLSLRQ